MGTPAVYAASGTWQNLGTDWNTDANWSVAPFPGELTTDVATFTGAATQQPTLSAPVSISQVSFSDAAAVGYTISGSPITLNSTGTGTASAINASSAGVGTNTISANIILGAAAGGDMRINVGSSGSAFELNLSGNISSTNSLTRLYYDANAASTRTVTLSGNNTYTAATTELRWATFNVNSPTAFGNSTVVGSNNPRLSNTSGAPVTIANNYNATSSFSFNTANNPSTWDLTVSGSVDLSGGNRTIDVGSGGGKFILSNVNVGAGNRQHQKGGNGILSLPNAITGTGLNQTIGGVVYNNCPWRINAGTLEVGDAGALGASIDLRAGLQASTALTVPASVVHATNNTSISGSNNINISGAYILSNGANSRTLNITNTGTTTFSGTVSLTDTAGDASQTLTMNVDEFAGATVVSGVIQNLVGGGASTNGMGFGKSGAGTLTLNNVNTFSGGLTVSGGTLVGTTAGAFGAASGAINVTGGTLQPDGNLTYVRDGSLTIGVGGGLRLGLSSTPGVNDKIGGTGSVTFNGNLTIDLPVSNPPDGATFTLIDGGKSVTYGIGFSVSDPVGGTWTGDSISGGWAYSTGTGVYSFSQATKVVTFAADSDGDGLPDAWEIANGLNPNSSAGNDGQFGDPDGDGYTNEEEFAAGSKPTNPGGTASIPGDVDGDNLPDAWENVWFPGDLTQLSGLGGADKDADGVSDLDEYTGNSSPNDPAWTPTKAKLANRWSFTTGPNQLVDSAGSSNAVVVPGATSSTNPVTFSGNAVTLAGGVKADSDAVNLGSNLVSNAFPTTIELWATQNAAQSWSRIFAFGVGTSEYLYMSWSQGTNVNQDRVEWRDVAATTTGNNTNAPYTPGQKHHIVMTLTPAPFTGGALTTGTRVTWYRTQADAPSVHHPLWSQRGTFDTSNNLADLNDAIGALGLAFSGDNVASATYDEVRIWHGALTENEREVAQAVGPDVSDLTTDTDGDGMPDSWESAYGLNPAVNDAAGHADGDGETNLTEFINHSVPNNTNSTPDDRDADGLDDFVFEDLYFADLDETGAGDPDGDFCNNEMEETGDAFGPTDPTNPFSFPDDDLDGLPDGYEDHYFGNNDGLTDPAERALQSDIDDFDNDGEDNFAEFSNGTDPTDPFSRSTLPTLFGLISGATRNGEFELQGPLPGAASGTKRASWDQAGAADVTHWTEWASQSTASGNSGVEGGAGLQHAFMQGGNAVYNLTDYIAAEGNTYWFAFDKINALGVEVYLVYQDGSSILPLSPPLMISTTTGTNQLKGYQIPAASPAIGKKIGLGFKSLASWVAFDNVRFGPVASDIDGDGYDDAFEDWAWGNNNGIVEASDRAAGPAGDADADGLSNLDEVNGTLNTAYGNLPTKANNPDSDGDGATDGFEILTAGTNPNNPDTDGDGLADGVETNTGTYVSPSNTGTNPLLADTDNDGFSDGQEIAYGTNPNSNASVPATTELIGLTLRNGSFETLNGVVNGAKASHWDTDSDGDVDNWTIWSEQSTASNDSGTEGTGSAFRDGAKHGYFQNGNAARNMTTHLIAEGDIIRLTYARTTGGNLTAYLISDTGAGFVQLPGTTAQLTNSTGNKELFFVVPGGHASIGQPLGVAFKSTGGWEGVDKVVLTIPGTNPDSDSDGMDDAWETTYGLNVGVDDSASDLDSDGTDNLTEFRLGLIPNSGSSRFFATRGANGLIQWQSQAGLTFTIERSTTMAVGSWTTLEAAYPAAASPATSTSYTDPAPPVGKAFYRIILNP